MNIYINEKIYIYMYIYEYIYRYEETWKRLRAQNSAGLGLRQEKELSDRYDFLVARINLR